MSHLCEVHTSRVYTSPSVLCAFGGVQSEVPLDRKGERKVRDLGRKKKCTRLLCGVFTKSGTVEVKDRFYCRATKEKKNESKNIHWFKSRNCNGVHVGDK